MKRLIPFLVSGILVVGAVGCQQGSDSADSTGTTTDQAVNAVKDAANTTETAVKDAAGKAKDTATDAAAKTGDTIKGAVDGAAKTAAQSAGGVKTIMTNKLAEKFPNSKLEVNEQDGTLVISGTVPDEETLKKIEPAVKEYKFQGIKTVKVDAKVAEAQ